MMIHLFCVLLGICAEPQDAAPPPLVFEEPQPAAVEGQLQAPLLQPMAPAPASPLPPEAWGDIQVVPLTVPPTLAALPAPTIVPPSVEVPAAAAPAAVPPHGLPAWRRFAVAPAQANGKPALTIMIDDMGLNGVQTARAVALPAPMTLSWMPYAPHVSQQAANAAARGHETMVHMPMEALGRLYPGPDALRTWLPPDTNLAYLRAALDIIPNAVALNQHEGSVASLSVPLMDEVMVELKQRGLAFVDSLTIPHSVALRRAQAAGLPSVARDVFLDNDPNPAAIRARLAEAEAIARHYGHVIAIGHPRGATMDVLEQYVPGLAARGFVLWPVSATIAAENRMQLSQAPVP